MSRFPSKRAALKGFFGLSLILHLNLFLLITGVMALNPDGCKSSTDLPVSPFEVTLVPQSDIKPIDPKVEEELKKEEEKEKEKDKEARGQVVEIAPPKEEKQPENSKFLSEYDSKVAKQTKGPAVPHKPGKVVAERQPQQQQQQATPEQQRQLERKVMKLAMRKEPELPRSELPKSPSGDAPARTEMEQREQSTQPRAENVPASKKRISMKDLQLTDEELGRAVGSRVNDYLKDVEEGAQTLLNTKRWRFASFFNRVKRQVAQNWHPDVVYRRRDPAGNVYGFRDRLTILRVRLTPAGALKDLHLEKACGVGFLDDEAIAAFKAAQPFPNPPPGLVDKETGMISFRFGFLFEISSRPGFRIFRYQD